MYWMIVSTRHKQKLLELCYDSIGLRRRFAGDWLVKDCTTGRIEEILSLVIQQIVNILEVESTVKKRRNSGVVADNVVLPRRLRDDEGRPVDGAYGEDAVGERVERAKVGAIKARQC